MKITRVETIRCDEFWHVLWVRIHTDNGLVGLGETWYLPRAVSSVIHEIYAPMLIGKDPMDREALAPLAKQRKALGDQIEIAHDGGGQWQLAPAIKITQAMDEYDIFWQEEMIRPINVETHLKLAAETKALICAAERLISKWNYREFIERGAAEIVMPDLIWTGGITETKKIATLAETYQTPVAPHDWTGPVNVFACAHISMSCPNVMVQETNRAYYRGWYDKFVEPNIKVKDGFLLAPEGPGLGTRLKSSVLDRPDVHVEATTEAAEWNWPGFTDPGQKVAHWYQPKTPARARSARRRR